MIVDVPFVSVSFVVAVVVVVFDDDVNDADGAISIIGLDIDNDTDNDVIAAAATADILNLYRNDLISLSINGYELNSKVIVLPNPTSDSIQLIKGQGIEISNAYLTNVMVKY